MKLSNHPKATCAIIVSYMVIVVGACATSQPEFECSAQNHTTYQVRYYRDEANSTCPTDAGYFIGSLVGGTAGMESYMLITPDGGGGPDVYFTNTSGKLDRSATKLGLRFEVISSPVFAGACDDDFENNCSEPDAPFACEYCVTIVGDGGAGTTYTLPDGTNAEDSVLLPDGGIQGVEKPTADGGLERISLSNSCDPGKKDDIIREADASPDPNLFLMLPRYGTKGICTPLNGGPVTSKSVFPAKTCKDNTKFDSVEISTTLTNFRLSSSPSLPGVVAKAQLTFEEKQGANASCKAIYRAVLLAPQVPCKTNLDCSPDPVPQAGQCGKDPAPTDFCLSGAGAGAVLGSGITPWFFNKLSDGGYNLDGVCDQEAHYCIWNTTAGGI